MRLLPLALLCAAACGGGSDSNSPTPPMPAAVSSVAVTPAILSLIPGGTGQLTATVRDAAGGVLSGRAISWQSSAIATATVSADGAVSGVAFGTATISATSEGRTGVATINVTQVPVATVTVTPAASALAVGGTVQLVATIRDGAGAELVGRSIAWQSSATTVATVSNSGLLTAVGAGSSTITATSESKSNSASVVVTIAPPTAFLQRPFVGEFLVLNPMDHDTPEEFVDVNGRMVTVSGELSAAFDSHAGYDYMMPIGTSILAAAAGAVVTAESATFFCPILGRNVNQLGVQIQHVRPGGSVYWTYYAHLSRIDVTVGQVITAGTQIGLSGNTSCTTAPHLHFQLDRLTSTNNGLRATVDPYGWTGATPDPWEQNPKGAKSLYLWLAGQAPEAQLGLNTVLNPLNYPGSSPTKKPVGISGWRYMGDRDASNPNNEYVEVRIDPTVFAGPQYDLTGHWIKNNAGVRYDFPAGFTIAQGQTVRVYVGSGTNTSSTLYWGRPSGIFNNLGDCAQLFFPGGGFYLLGLVSCS